MRGVVLGSVSVSSEADNKRKLSDISSDEGIGRGEPLLLSFSLSALPALSSSELESESEWL